MQDPSRLTANFTISKSLVKLEYFNAVGYYKIASLTIYLSFEKIEAYFKTNPLFLTAINAIYLPNLFFLMQYLYDKPF